MAALAIMTLITAAHAARGGDARWLVAAGAGLAGYIAAQGIVAVSANLLPGAFHALACALWLCLSWVVLKADAVWPGVFYFGGAVTYAVAFSFGQPLGHMQWPNVLAETFTVLALVAIGNGMFHGGPDRHRRGLDRRVGVDFFRRAVRRAQAAEPTPQIPRGVEPRRVPQAKG